MSSDNRERAFIEVALAGINVREGQSVAVKAEPIHGAFVAKLAEEAYRNGARIVDIWLQSAALQRKRIDSSDESFLDFVPRYHQARMEEYRSDTWALLSIKSPDDPAIMEGVDTRKLTRLTQAYSDVEKDFRRALSNDETQWCVVPLPSVPWAKRVTGITDGDTALKSLWDHLAVILRLDREHPGDFWRQHGRDLAKRAEGLTKLKIRSLRFQTAGTDLTIGLSDRAIWKGGNAQAPDGREFLDPACRVVRVPCG